MEPVASAYEVLQKQLRHSPRKWLVTGVAGFIGSNLLENLLLMDQIVVGVDNFSTGDAFTMDKFKVEFEKVEFIFKYEF